MNRRVKPSLNPKGVYSLTLQTGFYQNVLYYSYEDLYKIYSEAVRSTLPVDKEMVSVLLATPPRPPTQNPTLMDFTTLGNTLHNYGLIG